MEKLLVILLLGMSLISCGKTKKPAIKHINPIKVKKLQNDLAISSYTLTCGDSSLIATDRKTNKISVFGYSNLEVLHEFGRTGRGPGEFIRAFYTEYAQNRIYVLDTESRRVTVFNTSDWSLDTTITQVPSEYDTRFVVLNGYMYLPSVFGTQQRGPFVRVNLDNRKKKYFGKRIQGLNKQIQICFRFVSYKGKIIAISEFKPIIQIYNKKGKLLSTHNLARDRNLAKVLTYVKHFHQNPDNSNRPLVLFQDASIFKNYLLIEFVTRPNSRGKTNNYLVYKIDGNNLKKVGAFETNNHGGYTSTFCTHGNKLYSNGGASGINLFVFDLSFLGSK